MRKKIVESKISTAEEALAPQQIAGVTRVSAEQVIDLLSSQSDVVIIDSRKSSQYIKGHIQGALNILDTRMTESILQQHLADYSTPVIFYCYGEKCLRSANAASKARDWGYTKIYWFRGGWKEWLKKQMPVSRLNK